MNPVFVAGIDPASAPTTTGNLRLQATSLAINVGNNNVANPALPATDLDGAPRIVGGTVDLGAYELLAPPTLTNSTLAVASGGTLSDLATRTGAPPGGGVFSGTGVSVDGNGRYVFTSATLAVGTQVTITYTITGPGGTTNSTTFTVTVTEAPSLVVTTANDSAPGTATDTDGLSSLREALAYANSGTAGANPVITFAAALNGQTITLTQGELAVTGSMTIRGNGAANTIIDGNDASRIFNIEDDTNTVQAVTITGTTLQHARGSIGGAIYNAENLTLADNIIAHNSTDGANGSGGAGIRNEGTLTSSNNTISDNSTAGGAGAGIRNGGTLTASNDTLTNNSSTYGGGLANSGNATLTN